MATEFKRGFEVDNKAFAETLREMADGIENGTVALHELDESHDVDAEDVSVATLSIEYWTENSDLITPIKYE